MIACLALAVPTVGSFYPVPAFPIDIFPYIFVAWMAIGGSWLYALSRRQKHMFAAIEVDLEASMAASVQSHHEEMGTLVTFDRPPAPTFERPIAPTFEELDLALESAS